MPQRRLALVRHARAAAAGGGGGGAGVGRGADEHRPLTEMGRRQAAATAGALRAAGLGEPDLVLVSSAVRARQTWEVIGAFLAAGAVRVEPALYETSAAALVHLLAATPDRVRTLVVVGHEPVVSATALALAGEGSEEAALARVRVGAGTGSATVLAVDGGWAGLELGACRLLSTWSP